jgi:hypothetical protein
VVSDPVQAHDPRTVGVTPFVERERAHRLSGSLAE